ncbi:MAG: matrixin family metalloprotease [Candidatus Poribacteria bacterium]|nr:matrixin family metalloprotease [Candidatus Poribacteria bacterium]
MMRRKEYCLIILSILTFILFSVSSDAIEQFKVRVIYFQPTDAPAQPDNLQDIMRQTQEFYGVQMELYKYGFKTFDYEEDGDGDIVIHAIKGNHKIQHYAAKTYQEMIKEIPFEFRSENVNSQDTAHIFIVGGLHLVDNVALGIGWAITSWRTGGNAVIAGNQLNVSIVAHELGHAFGLYHTDVPNALMGPGNDILLDYETRWLDRHHFFNDTHIRTDIPEFLVYVGAKRISAFKILFKAVVRSNSGLYHVQMCRNAGAFAIGSSPLEGNSDVAEIEVSRHWLKNGDDVWFQIMDINGNHIVKDIRNITIPEKEHDPNPVIINKNPENIPADDLITIEKEDEGETPEIKPCPNCLPNDEEKQDNNLAIHPKGKLTTQWARLKLR